MKFYMFVHNLSDDRMFAGQMIGALKFSGGTMSVTGSKSLISYYKQMMSGQARTDAERSDGNPFAFMFGASTVPRFHFNQGEDGETEYKNFVDGNSKLLTEKI